MLYHWHHQQNNHMAAVAPYQFKPDSASLSEQADGTWIANFELSAFQGQSFNYTDQGINSDNYRVIDVNIEGDETSPVTYRPGQTSPFARGSEIGVELAAKKGGKVRNTIGTSY